MLVVLYFVVGLICSFSALTLIKVKGWEDGVIEYLLPILTLILWPVAISIAAVALLVVGMQAGAEATANRIKAKFGA